MIIRPSTLPKLAKCPRYEPAPGATAATLRGIDMDAAFRTMLAGRESPWIADPEEKDYQAVQWAVDTARLYARGAAIETRERELRVRVLGMTGTADALCAARRWSADLKTGEMHDYTAQQAAYALGFMDREQVEHWSVLLLFCDVRELLQLDFTRESATQLLCKVLDHVRNPLARATPCEFCDWCASRKSCAARLNAAPLATWG